jgi:hypothetical protein
MWIWLIWLMIGTSGRLLETPYWTFQFPKMLGNSWVAAQLAARQEFLRYSHEFHGNSETVILVSESRGTRDRILLSQIWDSANLANLSHWSLVYSLSTDCIENTGSSIGVCVFVATEMCLPNWCHATNVPLALLFQPSGTLSEYDKEVLTVNVINNTWVKVATPSTLNQPSIQHDRSTEVSYEE